MLYKYRSIELQNLLQLALCFFFTQLKKDYPFFLSMINIHYTIIRHTIQNSQFIP